MKIIVCIDDRNGMLFNKRRQSKDSALRQDVLTLTKDARVWMNHYSAAQFGESGANIVVDDAFLDRAESDDYCFVENTDIAPYADRVKCVILYRWNRAYPSDTKFPEELFCDKWKCTEILEFVGSSHEKITREVYWV